MDPARGGILPTLDAIRFPRDAMASTRGVFEAGVGAFVPRRVESEAGGRRERAEREARGTSRRDGGATPGEEEASRRRGEPALRPRHAPLGAHCQGGRRGFESLLALSLFLGFATGTAINAVQRAPDSADYAMRRAPGVPPLERPLPSPRDLQPRHRMPLHPPAELPVDDLANGFEQPRPLLLRQRRVIRKRRQHVQVALAVE